MAPKPIAISMFAAGLASLALLAYVFLKLDVAGPRPAESNKALGLVAPEQSPSTPTLDSSESIRKRIEDREVTNPEKKGERDSGSSPDSQQIQVEFTFEGVEDPKKVAGTLSLGGETEDDSWETSQPIRGPRVSVLIPLELMELWVDDLELSTHRVLDYAEDDSEFDNGIYRIEVECGEKIVLDVRDDLTGEPVKNVSILDVDEMDSEWEALNADFEAPQTGDSPLTVEDEYWTAGIRAPGFGLESMDLDEVSKFPTLVRLRRAGIVHIELSGPEGYSMMVAIRELTTTRQPWAWSGEWEAGTERDLAFIPTGSYCAEASLPHPTEDDLILGRLDFVVKEGQTVDVHLAPLWPQFTTDPTCKVGGIVRGPESIEGFWMRIDPRGRPRLLTEQNWAQVGEPHKVSGQHEWPWSIEGIFPGTYDISIPRLQIATQIEVPPGGRRDYVIDSPPMSTVTFELIGAEVDSEIEIDIRSAESNYSESFNIENGDSIELAEGPYTIGCYDESFYTKPIEIKVGAEPQKVQMVLSRCAHLTVLARPTSERGRLVSGDLDLEIESVCGQADWYMIVYGDPFDVYLTGPGRFKAVLRDPEGVILAEQKVLVPGGAPTEIAMEY